MQLKSSLNLIEHGWVSCGSSYSMQSSYTKPPHQPAQEISSKVSIMSSHKYISRVMSNSLLPSS